MENLKLVLQELNQKRKLFKKKKVDSGYTVPFVWTDTYINTLVASAHSDVDQSLLHEQQENVRLDFFSFFIDRIEEIISNGNQTFEFKKSNLFKSSCYNLFIRYGCAFGHKTDNAYFREQGTLLKAIALLPYLKAMGYKIIHLLPITKHGKQDKKGNLGSPYAIKNFLEIEPELIDPFTELSPEIHFTAFVEAAHCLGIAVSTEFIFRTASIDSDLALQKPEWFYWISNKVKNRDEDSDSDAKYGRPNFSKRDLKAIKNQISAGDYSDTIPPREKYRQMFTEPPAKVARADGKITGFIDSKTTNRLPHAFADWPPDDPQPSWDDVTYLKLYDHPDFNYMAYNTLRMYDTALAIEENENKELWEFISDIIPYWIEEFGIDGALLDMAHALPEKLLSNIKSKIISENPEFFFLGEFFSENTLTEAYFDGIVGGYCLSGQDPKSYLSTISNNSESNTSLSFLSPENHNTKRVSKKVDDNSLAVFYSILNALLPGIYFTLNGTEVYDPKQMNTGLGFTMEEISDISQESLPLFSASAIDWGANPTQIRLIRDCISIRENYLSDSPPDLKVSEISDGLYDIVVSNHDNTLKILCNIIDETKEININGYHSIFGWNYSDVDSILRLKKLGISILIED
ncbi:MAG: alpha-amylase family glycosyl hydrolase [Candidatus Kapaibacteriales bacterium]